MTAKYQTGAFCFTRNTGVRPVKPEDVVPLAERHGIDPSVIPPYAGDRAAVGRAISRTDTKIGSVQYLLRPIKRNSREVVYGIVREDRTGEDHLDHDHECTVRWTAEPNPEQMEGSHTLVNRIHLAYAELRGKLVADDWTSAVTSELDRLGAVPFREDGRVYWVPPQSLDDVRKLREFLLEVGVTLVMAEVESENTGVVTQVVAESVDDQLHKLEIEVREFDETQKPSMFARRLDEYQTLRQKAVLYQSALGIGAERTEKVLNELERKVSAMLGVRQTLTVHKDGSVSRKGEKAQASPSSESQESQASPTTPQAQPAQESQVPPTSPASQDTPQASPLDDFNEVKDADGVDTSNTSNAVSPVKSLTFAGSKFVAAESEVTGELVFTSGDQMAQGAVKGLEAMGLAGVWQSCGKCQVSIQNSGPKGAETSIRLKVPSGMTADAAGKALAGLGIGVG